MDRQGPTRSRIYVVGKQRVYWVQNDYFRQFDPTTTGIRTPLKICLSCARLKPLVEYPNNQNNKAGASTTRPRCKDCYEAESGPNLTTKAKRDFKKKVQAPEKGDLWRCPVCRKISIADVNASVRVDHDQERRQPRGLICDSCNTGLGRFKNGEDHLQRRHRLLAGLRGRTGKGVEDMPREKDSEKDKGRPSRKYPPRIDAEPGRDSPRRP